MKVEYLLVHLKGTPENHEARSKKRKKYCEKLTGKISISSSKEEGSIKTIWFSEKPGKVPEDKQQEKFHILIHKSYIGIEICLLFSFFKRKMDFIEVIKTYSNLNNSGERIAINAKREHLESGIQGDRVFLYGIDNIVNFENLQMHKYIPEREVGRTKEKKHFSVYQMMLHSAIWSEQGFMFSLYQYTVSFTHSIHNISFQSIIKNN
ncbi:hypothetical protein ACJX0J_004990 [Zea mays]